MIFLVTNAEGGYFAITDHGLCRVVCQYAPLEIQGEGDEYSFYSRDQHLHSMAFYIEV